MANTPVVAVGRPDDLGFRKVTIDDKPAGKVRCPRELDKLLRHAGLAAGHEIDWHGGDGTVWPDHAWRRRAYGALMAAGLLATAYVFVLIGISDTFNALTYAGRLTGFTFFLAALIEVVAAAATVDYWQERHIKHSGILILIAVAGSLAANLVLLFVQIRGRTYTHWLWLWLTLIPWSIWALRVLIRSRAWKGLQNPRRIAIGVIISTFLALANTAYTQIYVPYATSPLVQSTAEYGSPSLNEERTKLFLPVHLHMKNSGQIPVYVLGSIYWIRGRLADSKTYELITSDEFILPSGRPLNPGEEWSEDEVVTIKDPENKDFPYEAIKVETEAYVARKDRMAITDEYLYSRKGSQALEKAHQENDPPGPEAPYYRYQSVISNSNEILNMTRGRQRITLWHTTSKSYPYLYANVAPPDERKPFDPNNRNANQENARRYGLTKARGSMTQKPFAEILESAQAEQHSSGEAATPTR
ncbi:hypothetical protein ACFTWH_14555 [Streptomyces sp. NPDC057011]|uniref:hypothetical protein n=1 Tax=unclassified Streptomyces TaxID=2593676 RepID=UPI003644F506